MASLRSRTSSSGVTTHSVLYRLGRRQTSETFTDLKSAERFKALVDMLGPEKALATLAEKASGGLTVAELAERFFEWKTGDVTPRTIRDYRRDYANWIEPTFGHRLANTVDEVEVQRWVDKMRGRLEPKSVADRHMLLFSMYRFGSAKTRRLVEHNPCTETDLPRRERKPAKGCTLPEYHALQAAAREVEPDAADLMEFIAGTGWRWSEAAALAVRNVEAFHGEDGQLQTYAVMQAVMRRDEANRQVVTEGAKSRAGLRRVRLSPRVAALVERRTAGRGPDDLVFTNSSGRKWYQQNFLNRTWPRILDRAQLERRITPHALRHAHVAMLDRARVSLPEIQRRIGHESIQTTIDVYGGMIDHIDPEALEAIDRMLAGPPAAAGQVVAGEVVSDPRALS